MAVFNKDIVKLTEANTNWQQEVYYDKQIQIVMMSIPPGEDIGEETHEADQTTFVVSGEGQAVVSGATTAISPHHLVIVPKGAKHNFINKGDGDLKIYTVYAPPAEEKGISHKTKEEAEAAEAD